MMTASALTCGLALTDDMLATTFPRATTGVFFLELFSAVVLEDATAVLVVTLSSLCSCNGIGEDIVAVRAVRVGNEERSLPMLVEASVGMTSTEVSDLVCLVFSSRSLSTRTVGDRSIAMLDSIVSSSAASLLTSTSSSSSTSGCISIAPN